MWGYVRTAVFLTLMLYGAAPALAQIRVTAAWDANGDGLTEGYRVFVGVAPGSYVADINVGRQTSLPLDLPLGQVYYIAVRAYSTDGRLGPPSVEVTVDLTSAPGAPTDFRSSVNGSQATLHWGPPASGGAPIQYLLTVGSAPGGADIVSSYPVGAGGSVSGELPQGRYYARLRAANVLGAGPFTPEIAFQINGGQQPSSPSGLAAAWQGTVATLSWTAPAGGPSGSQPTSYVIEAGRSSGTSDVATLNVGNVTAFSVDVPPGTYYVRVRGVNAFGVSNPSNEIVVQGRGGPGRPTGLSASGSGASVVLHWNAPGSGAPPTGYVIEAGSAPGLSNLAVLTVGNHTAFETTAPPGTYYVRVRAMNGRGIGEASNEIVVRR